MPVKDVVKYICPNCSKQRAIAFAPELRERYIIDKTNGLARFSDIHLCKNNLLEVVNLRIDADLNVRGTETLTIPEYKDQTQSLIPVPGVKPKEVTELVITHIFERGELNFVLYDEMIKTQINLGGIKANEVANNTLSSEMGMVELKMFPSKIEYTPILEKWLYVLINVIEILPPTTVGLLVETLKYILDNSGHEPHDFDKKFLKTILASHEVFFKVVDENRCNLESCIRIFGEGIAESALKLTTKMRQKSDVPILSLAGSIPGKDFTFIIYLSLLLEKENIVSIERPGIVNY